MNPAAIAFDAALLVNEECEKGGVRMAGGLHVRLLGMAGEMIARGGSLDEVRRTVRESIENARAARKAGQG